MVAESSDNDPLSFVQTVNDGRIELRCPVCRHDKFLASGPVGADRPGFRHVLVGLSGKDSMMATPVGFRHCANCGFVLQFMIAKPPGEE